MLLPDDETCYRAVQSRDARFDGWFFTAVRTTGIYCRPSCPAITPRRRNVTFHPSAAAAQRAGYRACKRCRPDASPGSPEWHVRGDVAGRALRLIDDGVVDRDGVPGLARRLGYSQRQVHRTLVAEVGAGPLALARAQRAQTARVLLETTDLSAADVAFAAGFASVRQFNDTVRDVFAATPSSLRAAGRVGARHEPGTVTLRLPYREPMTVSTVLDFLGAHAVPGLERYEDGVFTRLVPAPHGPALVSLSPGDAAVICAARLQDLRDLVTVVARVRRLLDLDADPVAVDAVLGRDPALAPLVAKRPGLRAPGSVDGFETAVRTVVGQQISVSGSRTVLGRIVAEYGEPTSDGWLSFPTPATLAAADAETLPMPRARGRAVRGLAEAFAAGHVALDTGVDRDEVRADLLALRGVGPWTADYLLMRTVGHPDVLLTSDLVVRRAAADLGVELADGRPDWAPWRTYATYHLWAHLYADLWSVTP
ncbi:DNA-3-methyladenine glycosylase II [Jatrophihabitans endophyticus]|uniref:DNA-3-methyladenine glycosylase II n=1 Tax=Jatrophihabitans endophyticus TaxID=1206085 RepID=A0A1M5U6E4_9ACTN|nr:AlkA N-terminal domain-containing protein [Jatrophihabitans endophyticus]SHH58293.1 DNA-3-methyladenine glycosylase II [Jatrophihabitans endophyticus]